MDLDGQWRGEVGIVICLVILHSDGVALWSVYVRADFANFVPSS